MNAWWQYFWPLFGRRCDCRGNRPVGFRGRPRPRILALGVAVSLALALLWHGPLGAAHRFSATVEHQARIVLDNWEMGAVTARLHHGPLTRRLVLSGPGDDFQRGELVRTMETLPGVSGAGWSNADGGPPLIAEAAAVAIAGFLFGLLLAYLVELRRRYNAQWNW